MQSIALREKRIIGQEVPIYISWENFQRRYLTHEDGYKYEWLNGTIEKTKRTFNSNEFHIFRNITAKFRELQFSNKVNGELISEADVFFLNIHRRPDIAYFDAQQIDDAADGINPTPKFVIEFISDKDKINRVNSKMQNYRAANVETVWQIFLNTQEVHVYQGDNLDLGHIKRGDMVCSAGSTLPDFNMRVSDIFKRKNA